MPLDVRGRLDALKRERPPLTRYGIAVFAAASSTLVRLLFNPLFGNEMPFLFHYPAIVASAWFGGFGAGIVTTLLCVLAAWGLFISPASFLAPPSASGQAQLIVVVLAGFMISTLAESLHRSRRSASERGEELRVTLSSIGDAVIAADAGGRVTFMNPVAESLTGWPEIEAKGTPLQKVFRIVNEGTRAEVEDPVSRVMREGTVVGLANHTILLARDGRELPIDDSAAPIPAADGGIAGAVLVFRDISEKRRAEADLLRARERFLGMYESSKDAISYSDLDGTIVDVNQAFCELTGYSKAELIGGMKYQDLTPREYHQTEAALVESILRTGEPVTYQKEYVRKEGSRVPLEATRFLVRGRDGKPAGVAAFLRDITERKRAEEAIRRSEERFRTLADSAPVLVWMSGTDKLCNFFNQPWLTFTGRTMEQEMGNGWTQGVHPEDLPHFLAIYTTAFDARREFEMEYRLRRFDGEYRWVLNHGVPLYGPGGEFAGYIGSCIDLTERKRGEEERERLLALEREARSQAEAANRAKDEFLATISHELRNPLNAILGWTKVLSGDPHADEKTREKLAIVERNAKSQAQLIEDLLDVSRIITGKIRLDVRAVMVAAIVDSAIEAVRPAAEAKGVKVQAMVDPSAGPVSADSGRLQQVLWNLLSNAIKFTPRGGRVQVTVERINSHVEIAVRDTGIGIRGEFLPYVFDRFRQAQGGTTRSYGGLGLGLAIVRHLVELHGGSVKADSDGEGKGATFTVRLPLMVSLPVHSDEERVHPAVDVKRALPFEHPPNLSGARILVIDDEPDTRELLRQILERCGAEVTSAGSAREGLAVAKESSPDVVVSDIGMPREDGYTLIEKLREWERNVGRWTPAIALTAYARAEDRIRALSAGYQVHVAKPIEPLELALTVAGLLGGGRRGPES